MCSGVRVVFEIRLEDAVEVPSIENDDVVEAFAPNRSNQPFDNALLTWARWSCHHLLDVETRKLVVCCSAVHSIAITDQVTRRIPIRQRLDQLLCSPFHSGVLGNVEVQNFAPAVSENNQDEQHLEAKHRHGEEIDSNDLISSFFRNVFQFCNGGRGMLRRIHETVRSETTIPSSFSSPCICGARQTGFAVTLSTMRRLISGATRGLPLPAVFRREMQAHNLRKRSRCHRRPVSGCTTHRAVPTGARLSTTHTRRDGQRRSVYDQSTTQGILAILGHLAIRCPMAK